MWLPDHIQRSDLAVTPPSWAAASNAHRAIATSTGSGVGHKPKTATVSAASAASRR